MRSRVLVIGLTLSGCRTLLGLEPAVDTSSDAPLAIDASTVDAPRDCMERWLAGTPALDESTRRMVLSTGDFAAEASLSDDELTLWYTRGAVSGDIYQTTRTARTADFPLGAPLFGVNSSADERRFSSSSNGRLALVSVIGSGSAVELRLFQRPSATVPFELDRAVSLGGTIAEPMLSRDGTQIVTVRQGELLERYNLVAGQLVETESQALGMNVTDPWLSSDQRLLLVARSFVDEKELLYAVRSADGPFGPLLPLLKASGSDPFLSADGCTLYYGRSDGIMSIALSP